MAEPKCPSCSVQGIDKIVSHESTQQSRSGDTWFEVVCCDNCGHVYGVFAKHVLSHELHAPMPTITPTPRVP